MQLGAVCCRKAHISQDIDLDLVHGGGELRHRWAELVGDLTPLRLGGVCVFLSEGDSDEGRDDATALASDMSEKVACEVHATALPGGVEHLGDRGLRALVGMPRRPRRASLRSAAVQKVSASDGPISGTWPLEMLLMPIAGARAVI